MRYLLGTVALAVGCYSGGPPMGAGAGAGASDPNAICTSNTTYVPVEDGSEFMEPGNACIACHSSGDGPRFTIAGTLYPTAHEPSGCNGVDGTIAGAVVVITDANGVEIPLAVNAAGNFFTRRAVAMPFHARIEQNGNTRAMSAAQSTGDCNSCHTQEGAQGAPGRIVAP